MSPTEFLRRRNALWARLRAQVSCLPGTGSSRFEADLRDLCALTGWDRARVWAGLGLGPEDLASPGVNNPDTGERP